MSAVLFVRTYGGYQRCIARNGQILYVNGNIRCGCLRNTYRMDTYRVCRIPYTSDVACIVSYLMDSYLRRSAFCVPEGVQARFNGSAKYSQIKINIIKNKGIVSMPLKYG